MASITAILPIESSSGTGTSVSVFEDTEVPVPLEDSIGNMAVIEAIFRSAKSGQWERPQP